MNAPKRNFKISLANTVTEQIWNNSHQNNKDLFNGRAILILICFRSLDIMASLFCIIHYSLLFFVRISSCTKTTRSQQV
jgi:hypothetical protein